MASGKSDTFRNATIQTAIDAGLSLALCMTTAPTATSAATGLTTGGGYTAGGPSVTMSTPAAGYSSGHTADISLTNSSGSNWVITGVLLHSAGAAHPTASQVLFYDDTVSITVPNGGVFEIPQDAIEITET